MSLARVESEQQVVTLPPDATVVEAARIMAEQHVGAVVIATDGRPVGIITDRDISIRVVAARLDAETTPLAQVMSRPVVTARADTTDVATLMSMKGVRRIPLVGADGRVKSLVSLDDLLAIHVHRLGCLSQALATERTRETR